MVQRYRQWAAASLVAALAPASVHAAETHRFAIAAGRLDQAILELGRQGGVSVALADPAMGEIRVRRVAGDPEHPYTAGFACAKVNRDA